MSFQPVARLTDLPDGTLLGVVTPAGERVCLVNVDGEIHALGNTCTHQEFPISDGLLLPGGRIECAWHGAIFDCRTGVARRLPAIDPLPVYAVKVEDGQVLVGERLR